MRQLDHARAAKPSFSGVIEKEFYQPEGLDE
jgi:hypothetical protein